METMNKEQQLREAAEKILDKHLSSYGWKQMAKECRNDCVNAMIEFNKQQSINLNNIKKLCDLIVNSSPDTIIKGEIESLALDIGHQIIHAKAYHQQTESVNLDELRDWFNDWHIAKEIDCIENGSEIEASDIFDFFLPYLQKHLPKTPKDI